MMGLVQRPTPTFAVAPAAANGRVYVKFHEGSTIRLWVVDQATGTVLSKVNTFSLGSVHLAPVVFGDDVYMVDGIPDGVSKFSGASYGRVWSTAVGAHALWNPSVDASAYYVVAAGVLHAGSIDTGVNMYSIATVNPPSSGAVAPVLSDKQMAFASITDKLVAFDLAARKVAWTEAGRVRGQPAYAKGVVYVLGGEGNDLLAYAADTGTLAWKSANFTEGTNHPVSNASKLQVIVTDNLVFASTDRGTFALDLATHKTVWSHPERGDLSISQNGVLYIMPQDGSIHAVNLKQ